MRTPKVADAVIHKSDKKPRKMFVTAVCEDVLGNPFAERVRLKIIPSGSFYCTWISGKNKGEGFFFPNELELQDEA
jgi:hypothetical protein